MQDLGLNQKKNSSVSCWQSTVAILIHMAMQCSNKVDIKENINLTIYYVITI
jgi:hypothetical protein